MDHVVSLLVRLLTPLCLSHLDFSVAFEWGWFVMPIGQKTQLLNVK